MSIPASRTIDRLRVYEKYRCVHSVEQYFRFCRDTTDFFFLPLNSGGKSTIGWRIPQHRIDTVINSFISSNIVIPSSIYTLLFFMLTKINGNADSQIGSYNIRINLYRIAQKFLETGRGEGGNKVKKKILDSSICSLNLNHLLVYRLEQIKAQEQHNKSTQLFIEVLTKNISKKKKKGNNSKIFIPRFNHLSIRYSLQKKIYLKRDLNVIKKKKNDCSCHDLSLQ